MNSKQLAGAALVVAAIAAIFVAVFWPHLTAHPTPPAAHTPTTLGAPQPTEPGNGVTVDDAAITFQWTAVAGARQYRITLQICNHDAPCTDANTTSLPDQTSVTPQLTSAQLSAYLDVNARWRVWAVGANNNAGPPTAWQTFHAVKVLH